MSGFSTTIRDAVYDQIESDRSTYVYDDFDLQKTFFPRETLKSLGDRAAIKVVGKSISRERNRTLRNVEVVLLELPVEINLQKMVDPTNTEEIDQLVKMHEQLQDSLESDELVSTDRYIWQKTDALRDENGLTFSYDQLMLQNVLNIIFTVTYQYIKQP